MEDKMRCLNRDVIKYIAMFTMLLNHIAHVFIPEGTVLFEILVDVGYFTAVTMCYFLVEGYGYTRSKKVYGRRLLIFAVISQIPFKMAFGEMGNLNMMCTLFLCFLLLRMLEDERISSYKNMMIMGIVLLSCVCDWAVIAPMAVYWFYEAKGDLEAQKSVFFKVAGLFGVMQFLGRSEGLPVLWNLLLTAGSVAGILVSGVVILRFYNGKRATRGRTFSQYFFYWFYPVHLLILGILRMQLG